MTRRLIRALVVANAAFVVMYPNLAGCSADPDKSDTQDAGGSDADAGPAYCAARTALLAFVYANKSCTVDDDCVVAKTCLRDSDGCGGVMFGFYLSKSHDTAKWQSLDGALSSCGQSLCFLPGCDYVPPATCWHGSCWSDKGSAVVGYRDKCLQLFGRDSLCAVCYCAHNGTGAGDCLSTPGCLELMRCAHDNACLGSPKCAPENAASPCKAVVDAQGGPGAAVVDAFGGVNAYLYMNGCDVACTK